MVAILLPTRRSFLQERTIKFGIVQAFISIWLLVLVIYYAKGQSFMSPLQASVYQFLISTNIITLTFFLAFAALQVYSIRYQVAYACSSVISETTFLCVVIFLQTVAAIAFSASVHSFACSANTCRESVFFAIVAWLAPLLFVIHCVEFVSRARRLSTPETSVWKTATWLVNWEETAAVVDSKDIEKGLSAPKPLVLPVKAGSNIEPKAPKSKEMLAQRAIHKAHFLSKAAYRNMRGKSTLPPALPPKSPRLTIISEKDLPNKARFSSNGEQVILIVPSKLQFSVPRLSPPPKYFIQIPENISYVVPRLSNAPCPKTRAKERRKARKAAAAAAAGAVSPRKWVSTIMA